MSRSVTDYHAFRVDGLMLAAKQEIDAGNAEAAIKFLERALEEVREYVTADD